MARSIRNARETRAQTAPHIPPQNLEAEQSLLGGLLVDPESINKIVDMVGPGDFYKDAHSKIYDVMLDLYERNEAIDIITVSSLARDKGLVEKIGGITYLNSLVDLMPSAANIVHYAKMVREKALMRNLINAATLIIERS